MITGGPINLARLMKVMTERYRKTIPELYNRRSYFWEHMRPYLGRRGPVTFTGTPQEIVRLMRRYQKGLP